MKPAVNLQTKEGIEFYHATNEKYEWSKQNDLLDWYKSHLQVEGVKAEKALIDWSDQMDFDDEEQGPEIWKAWKREADRVAVINYFAKRTK